MAASHSTAKSKKKADKDVVYPTAISKSNTSARLNTSIGISADDATFLHSSLKERRKKKKKKKRSKKKGPKPKSGIALGKNKSIMEDRDDVMKAHEGTFMFFNHMKGGFEKTLAQQGPILENSTTAKARKKKRKKKAGDFVTASTKGKKMDPKKRFHSAIGVSSSHRLYLKKPAKMKNSGRKESQKDEKNQKDHKKIRKAKVKKKVPDATPENNNSTDRLALGTAPSSSHVDQPTPYPLGRSNSCNKLESDQESDTPSSPGEFFVNGGSHIMPRSAPEVQRWLKSIGFSCYAETFMKHKIDGAALLALDKSRLAEMGIDDFGQKRIMQVVSFLNLGNQNNLSS